MPAPKQPIELRKSGLFSWDDPGDSNLTPDYILVPGVVSFSAGRLRYERSRGQRKSPTPRILDGFLRLADATDEQITKFAKRWGPLYLCEHGLPASHNPEYDEHTFFPTPRCEPEDFTGRAGSESLDAWRVLSRKANAIVHLAQALGAAKRGASKDWQTLIPSLRDDASYEPPAPALLLALLANRWVRDAQIHLLVKIRQGVPVLRYGSDDIFGYGALFGALGIQLLLRITGPQAEVPCSACGAPYKPSRRPAASKANYCPKCGHPEAVRRAKFAMRQRQALARQLHLDGLSAKDIAGRVGSKPATVRGWLSARRRSRERQGGRAR
jgi:hypothetical protein